MDTKVTKTVTVPVADSSGNPAMNSVLADSTTSDETSEDLMRTLDDLMVKGYEPHLTFERDFCSRGHGTSKQILIIRKAGMIYGKTITTARLEIPAF